MRTYFPVDVGAHVRSDTPITVKWWTTTGDTPCPPRVTVHLGDGPAVVIYLDSADLDRLIYTLTEAQRTGGYILTGVLCETGGCGHGRVVHGDSGCDVTDCDCDEFRDEPQGAGADPYGRSAEDMARSVE